MEPIAHPPSMKPVKQTSKQTNTHRHTHTAKTHKQANKQATTKLNSSGHVAIPHYEIGFLVKESYQIMANGVLINHITNQQLTSRGTSSTY